MRRFLAAVAVAFGWLLFMLPSAATAAVPVECSGVPAGYTPVGLEAQGWALTGTQGAPDGATGAFWPDLPYDPTMADGHLHNSFDFPLCQAFGTAYAGRSTHTFTIHAHMHQDPGTLADVRAKVYSGLAAHQTNIGTNDFPNVSCAAMDCDFTFTDTADFSKVPDNGWQSFRIRIIGHDPNGQDRETILWGPVYIDNTGHPYSEYGKAGDVKATVWYTDGGYLNVSLRSPYPVAPITGPWTVNVTYWATTESCSDATKCADEPTHVFGAVDPAFHMDPPDEGLVVLDAPGPDTTSGVTKQVSVDPAALGLCNGPHTLFLRADADDDAPFSRDVRYSSVLKVPFSTNVTGQPACG